MLKLGTRNELVGFRISFESVGLIDTEIANTRDFSAPANIITLPAFIVSRGYLRYRAKLRAIGISLTDILHKDSTFIM